MIKVLIFDFDGVIAESVDVKTQAFRQLFQDNYPSKTKQIVDFHLANGGMSRFDKFRHIYKNILKEELSENLFKALCDRFNRLVVDDVIACPGVKGVNDFLEKYSPKMPMYIVSATPDAEIKEIVAKRSLSKYFLEVFGSPTKKADIIKAILLKHSLTPKEAIFIGDSSNDYQASLEANVFFAARIIPDNEQWLKSSKNIFSFTDFLEFAPKLENFLQNPKPEGK